MTIDQYISNINQRYLHGNATEHTYRGDLQTLIESIVTDIQATNEPKRQSCGAPDYILTRGEIPIGFIEAKDIGDKDLKGEKKAGNKEQFDRYKASLSNLIFTDYIDFYLYRNGQFVMSIAIAELFPSSGGVSASGGRGDSVIVPKSENFIAFENLIREFCVHVSQTIRSPKQLAEMMAGKARLLSDVIGRALISDEINQENSTLKDQMKAFKDILIHDITPQGFADVYAQTIAYGMFCARLHDPTLPTFSRQEAFELIPKSNPFLKKLFGYIAGIELDDRIRWIVEGLVDVFLACNVEELLRNYGKQTKTEEPIIHFYETFLSEYDPKLRKARGVWYTPAPVVNFIVRAVDDILKTEFNLPQGLADTSKTKIKVQTQGNTKPIEQEVHKVQILDPATGTGTFLAEVIRHIHKKFEGQQGIWSNYVEQHLIPRLNGFELLMASYAMAHLQLDLLLTETGFKPTTHQRLRVYLTNSLEESHPDTGSLFANWLSTEANEANQIKRDAPVMCVIGNPPYSGVSSNNGEWIGKLIEDYKYVDGIHFNERKHWLNDDYVKFIRYGQHFIEKNGSGVLAFINPHGYLDNPTFRGMRWHLLKTFDQIYTIDLHGNSKKKEVSPDGSPDQNVFDIMQGVSINIFVKTGKKNENELGKVFHYDLFGKRDLKYEFLFENSLKSINFQELNPEKPNLFLVPKNENLENFYNQGFQLTKIFNQYALGMMTGKDDLLISNNKNTLSTFIDNIENFNDIKEETNYFKWSWVVPYVKINKINLEKSIRKILYRPFDYKYVIYDNKLLQRDLFSIQKNYYKSNIGLIISRQGIASNVNNWEAITITNCMSDINMFRRGGGTNFPLYQYPDSSKQDFFTTPDPSKGGEYRKPNLNMEIVGEIAQKLGLVFIPEKFPSEGGVPATGEWSAHSPPLEGCPPAAGGVVLTTIHFKPIYRNFVENLPHNPALSQLAKDKRKEGILSEVLFWQQVHKGKFHHIDFDRQRVIGNYIVDFYVKTLGLIIEIDGSSHNDKKEYDNERQSYLESLGLRVYRISDSDVKHNIHGVMEYLEEYILVEYGNTHPALSGTPPEDGNEYFALSGTPPEDGNEYFTLSGTSSEGENEHFTLSGTSSEDGNGYFALSGTPPEDGNEYFALSGTPPEDGNEHFTQSGASSEDGNVSLVFSHASSRGELAPIDILDYIYAVLHSPSYREKYKEFLKIDFPRVPYPMDQDSFWKLVELGGELRQIHLLESPTVEKYITRYPIDGTNEVIKVRFEAYPKPRLEADTKNRASSTNDHIISNQQDDVSFSQPHLKSNDDMMLHEPEEVFLSKGMMGLGKVYINDTQYFDDVPQVAWEFYIGGYQPAQKWLKDRKDRNLEFDDILHYQKIIVALTETDRLMKEVDKINIE